MVLHLQLSKQPVAREIKLENQFKNNTLGENHTKKHYTTQCHRTKLQTYSTHHTITNEQTIKIDNKKEGSSTVRLKLETNLRTSA